MKAMQLSVLSPVGSDAQPLQRVELQAPIPAAHEVLLKVRACGVCHTELDEIEGRTPPEHLPVIPGHQVVAEVVHCGARASRHQPGDRVGVGWIGGACGTCQYCAGGFENLCPQFLATGRDINGGYAEFMTIDESMAHPIPAGISDLHAAPMLCAGAIGYRSLQLTGLENGQALGLTGFGGSAHLVLQMVRHRYPASPVYVFARNRAEQEFALELGASWAGGTEDHAPTPMQAIIDTTPAWLPLVAAMEQLAAGGRLVVNAIRKEDSDKFQLTSLDYPTHLWLEKEIKSVANVTRMDIREFLQLAAAIKITPEVECYPLEEANRALVELKHHQVRGSKVLVMD
ncbi:MAG: zinc-dependent alcohol dehydrogenase family protein [Gammaproteobacteria bacterium]|nr:zinc-dependent alcohol dehydrogenase family protein [Gammaproteobacteria bacterium]